MQTTDNRRIFFTADTRLAIKRTTRPIAAKFAAATAAGTATEVESIATLTGYPIVWNVLSTDRGGFMVRLQPGSAKFTTPTQALWHHDPSKVLGNTANTTLRMTPDDYGVKVEIDLPDTTDGNNAEELVEQKYVTGMSFAMVDTPDGETVTENGQSILNVTSFLCDEVTITGIPAFTDTSIEVTQDNVPEDADDPPAGYSSRIAQAHRLERLRFEFMTLPGAELPRSAV